MGKSRLRFKNHVRVLDDLLAIGYRVTQGAFAEDVGAIMIGDEFVEGVNGIGHGPYSIGRFRYS
jgi:hypothetical protein